MNIASREVEELLTIIWQLLGFAALGFSIFLLYLLTKFLIQNTRKGS
ncbi:hypothetical protein [Shouchella lonarensis]|uniref:Uncharacterized protein n=1 Tax=Shouchella lonarensis TaxID=1464122 RepID=A0A1G6NVK1_9BACI|nr:hypothetical protein [Shouchella lonarensis]SDC71185.1 hypothetical protein SAMN05421737_11368 [Shouchella lonarensis]